METGVNVSVFEDDIGLRCMLPASALAEAKKDLARAINVAANAFEGFGWNDIHVIQPPEMGYRQLGLLLESTAHSVEKILPRVENFTIFQGSESFKVEKRDKTNPENDLYCFGISSGCFLKIENSGHLVNSIWFQAWPSESRNFDYLQEALESIHALQPSIVVDYVSNNLVDLGERRSLDRYLAEIAGART